MISWKWSFPLCFSSLFGIKEKPCSTLFLCRLNPFSIVIWKFLFYFLFKSFEFLITVREILMDIQSWLTRKKELRVLFMRKGNLVEVLYNAVTFTYFYRAVGAWPLHSVNKGFVLYLRWLWLVELLLLTFRSRIVDN